MGAIDEDLYARLGLSAGASPAEVRRGFRELARRYHPDAVLPAERDRAHEAFIRIREAYHVLSDPVRRRAYDESLSDVILPGAIDLDDPMFTSDPVDDLLIEAEALWSAGLTEEAEEALARAREMAPQDTRIADMLRLVRPPGTPARASVSVSPGASPDLRPRGSRPPSVRPDGVPVPFEPLQGSALRAGLFVGGVCLGLAALAYPHLTADSVRWLGLGRAEALSVVIAAGCLAFALDLAALIRPIEYELAEDVGATPYGPLLLAAGVVHVLLAAAIAVVYATMNERWTYSVWVVLGLSVACAANGIAADSGAWQWGVAALGNIAFVSALAGWFAAGFFRRTHYE